MKLGDIVTRVVIDPRKLTHYALDPRSPKGRNKALLFEKLLGITAENAEFLLRQLEEQAIEAPAIPGDQDRFGIRYRVDVDILGTSGQTKTVRTGWLVAPGAQVAHLLTLFVKRG